MRDQAHVQTTPFALKGCSQCQVPPLSYLSREAILPRELYVNLCPDRSTGHQGFVPLHCLHSRGFMAIVYDFSSTVGRGKGVQKGAGRLVLRNNTFRNTLVAILRHLMYIHIIRLMRT